MSTTRSKASILAFKSRGKMVLTAKGFQGQAVQDTVKDVTVNKAKTADKAYTQMDGYIRG